jgi:hypothetical protein
MGKTTALCLIVMNELQGCMQDVPRLDFSQFNEVFAIDGNSADGTAEYLAEFGIRVYPQSVRSLNAAYWQAVETAQTDNLIVYFPKGTIEPSVVYDLKQHLDSHEVVVASRIGNGAANEEDRHLLRPRKWGIQALSVFTSLIWRREGPRMLDVLHGVKGFSMSAFRRMQVSKRGVTIDLEMNVRSYRLGLKRLEIPVIERTRVAGQTNFPIWPTGRKLAAFLLRELLSPKRLD